MLGKLARGLWGVLRGDPFWRYRLAEIVSSGLSRDSLDRKWMLKELLKLVRKVDGDTAECGTWRGGSSWLIARGLGRPHHAFDSFEGLSAPEPRDGAHFKKGDLAVSEEEFRSRMTDVADLRVYKGWIPSRFPEAADRKFCFVHVDVDLYQPTRDAIEFFYPRLAPGGILLLDDYGFFICPGARQAADEFFKDKPEPILEVPTGQGLVLRL